uniref:Uncharacterized protein n=1 Tax=Kalanchoe fedtschenkoi TaxID=63787 RepID=A0A7N0SY31_KALFE
MKTSSSSSTNPTSNIPPEPCGNLLDPPPDTRRDSSLICCAYTDPTPAAKNSSPSITFTSGTDSRSFDHWMQIPNTGGTPAGESDKWNT